MIRRFIAIAVCLTIAQFLSAQLVLNEVSQGSTGSREYVEFVVAGTPSCASSCVDLRGWIIDDNNGFHATGNGTGIAAGCLRFRNIAQWACVPYGSIILIYNENDKNNSIALADDPTDANNDSVYVIPGNSTVLEGNANLPSVPNGPSYSSITFTSPGSWNYVLMGNSDDAFHSVSPADLANPHFALGWGNNTSNVNIYFSGTAGGKVFYNGNGTNNSPSLQANWVSASVAGNETPGAPNNVANANWIASLRAQSATAAPVYTNNAVCILNGESIVLAGQPRTTAGIYNDTLQAANGCDSIVSTTLRVSTPITFPISAPPACDSFVFQGMVFRNDTIVRDTLQTSLGCDSIYRVATIQIKHSKRDTVAACINPGGSYFAGGANQTVPGFYSDVYTAANGCDSVRVTNLKLVSPTTVSQTVQACGSYVFNGNTYTSNTIVSDTLQTLLGCDSIYAVLNIQITSVLRDTIQVCILSGDSYFAGGALRTTAGFYSDTFHVSSCDSIRVIALSVVAPSAQQQTVLGCASVVVNGITYTSNTVVTDTIQSVLGCDSVWMQFTIQVNQVAATVQNVCINQGQSYFAGGANQTTSGTYTDTLPAANGCDSVVSTVLDVITIANQNNLQQGCDSVVFNGVTYLQSTTVFDTLRNSAGCITQITATAIVVRTATEDTVYVCINSGGQYFAGGAMQTTAGLYRDNYVSNASCDSVVITNLSVVSFTSFDTTIAACDSLFFNGNMYYQSTQLADTLRNAGGCVTAVSTYRINIGNEKYDSVYVCINPGESYFAGGANQTASGTFIDTITSSNICNTYRITYLTLIVPLSDTLPLVTAIDAYDWNGETFTSDTLAQKVVLSKNGCDSIVRIQPIKINKVLPYNIYMPNVFSPNDDGVNDILLPLHTDNIEVLDFKIFNRWGELVYRGIEGWDGYFNGAKQKPDTYVYTLKAQEKVLKTVEFLTGSITLIR